MAASGASSRRSRHEPAAAPPRTGPRGGAGGAPVKCQVCKRGPHEGVTLFRLNPKGVEGVWACREHMPSGDTELVLKNANVVIQATEPQQCDLCGTIAELRPYGPNGENICHPCGMKNETAMKMQFKRRMLGLPPLRTATGAAPWEVTNREPSDGARGGTA